MERIVRQAMQPGGAQIDRRPQAPLGPDAATDPLPTFQHQNPAAGGDQPLCTGQPGETCPDYQGIKRLIGLGGLTESAEKGHGCGQALA